MGLSLARKLVIVNADDLGFSPGVTEGILLAHREGLVTSATIAANMPAAAQAVDSLRDTPELGVGMHLNVSQGPPLSAEGRALAGQDGQMHHTAAGIILACVRRPRLLNAIEAEFDAQVRWALDHGLRPTHLDSHRHSHAWPPIFARVARLAERYHIGLVRWHRESLPGRGWPAAPGNQRRVRWLLNRFGAVNALLAPNLRGTRGTWGVAHTGLIDAAWLIRAARAVEPGVTEIMTHPGLGDDVEAATRLRESRLKELAGLCDPAAMDAFEQNGIELIHYGQIPR